MKNRGIVASWLVTFCILSTPAFPETPGLMNGIVSESLSGRPLGGVQIVAHDLIAGVDYATVTGINGDYTFRNLEAGQYEVVAAKNGFQKSSARVEVAASATSRVNVSLQIAPEVTQTSDPSEREKRLLERIDRLEARLAALEAVKDASAPPLTSNTEPVLLASLNPAPGMAATLPPSLPAPQTPGQAQASGPLQPSGKAGPKATPPTLVAPPEHRLPEALQAPEPGPAVDNFTPFAFADFTWLNGTPRNKDTVLDTKFFTPEVRFDTHYMTDFNQPVDHTIVGSTESFRSGEVQIEQASVGGDFHWENVRGRILFIQGLFATTTPRNDASAGVGQWDLRNAYRYVSEAYGGYHFNVNHGLNVDAGIFVSYIGLFSYYNFDNWAYQPSFVSSNTPWFFNGVRVQWFPTNKLKIEPWFINGWQSYAKYNGHPGLGGQLLWMPKEWFKLVANQYGLRAGQPGSPENASAFTRTTASRSDTITTRKAPVSRRWLSLSPRTRDASLGAAFNASAAPAKTNRLSSAGCSTTGCGSTRTCLALHSAAAT